jgi:curved DNA-binding protein CbpA
VGHVCFTDHALCLHPANHPNRFHGSMHPRQRSLAIFVLALLLASLVATSQASDLDPFTILGIDNDADEQTIKKAYRQLSRKLHPDHNPGDAESERKYKEVQEAYALLTTHRAQFEGGVFHTYHEYQQWKQQNEKKGKKKKNKKASRLYQFERDSIVDLTERKVFDEALKDRSKPIFVKFYANWY